MLDHRLCYITACDYFSMIKHRSIFNINQFPEKLIIRVDDELFENFMLDRILDENKETFESYQYFGYNVPHELELDPGFTFPDEIVDVPDEDDNTDEENPDEGNQDDDEGDSEGDGNGSGDGDEETKPENPDGDNPNPGDDNDEGKLPELGEGEVDFDDLVSSLDDDIEIDDNQNSGEDSDNNKDESDTTEGEDKPSDDDLVDDPIQFPDEPIIEIVDLTVEEEEDETEDEIDPQLILRPWIEIESKVLDTKPGLHIYMLKWINKVTLDVHLQYFSYSIQTDNPEKPYIYMDRDKKAETVYPLDNQIGDEVEIIEPLPDDEFGGFGDDDESFNQDVIVNPPEDIPTEPDNPDNPDGDDNTDLPEPDNNESTEDTTE